MTTPVPAIPVTGGSVRSPRGPSYLLGKRLARPIKRVSEALDEIARGHLDHRIGESRRKDEFRLLFEAFDRMAQALQPAPHAASIDLSIDAETPKTGS